MRSSDWLDIDTAPKNPEGTFIGPLILVWCTADRHPWPAQWAESSLDGDGCWRIDNDHAAKAEDNEISAQDVSHWMPIAMPWAEIEASAEGKK